jgi:hypothetical protein
MIQYNNKLYLSIFLFYNYIDMGLMELVDSMSLFGESLIRDDAGDLGYLTYRNRKRHTYHGKKSPHHPSPLHHYQIGTIITLSSYFLAPLAMALDMRDELVES